MSTKYQNSLTETTTDKGDDKMTGVLKLRLLGSPEVNLDEEPIKGFRSNKARALLYYLAVTRQPFQRPMLAGLLWGGVEESHARRSLNQTLSNLRQLVGDHLMIERERVAFDSSSSHWLDITIFEQGTQCKERRDVVESIDLYRGDFLEGFYVQDAPEFEQWVLVERARLRELALDKLNWLLESYQAKHEWSAAIRYARRILTLEPWREETHHQLMLMLAQSGQRSAALAQFEICQQVLMEELSVEPDRATVQLADQIRAGRLETVFSHSSTLNDHHAIGQESNNQLPNNQIPAYSLTAPTPYSLPIAHGEVEEKIPKQLLKLPKAPTTFVGRVQEVTLLSRLIQEEPECRLLTLVGPGGMGKTRLAVEVARKIYEDLKAAKHEIGLFADGICFVPLHALTVLSDIAPAIAEVLEFRFSGNAIPDDQLLSYLSQKRLLLILDNFEHLLAGAEFVSRILAEAPHVKIIVTTRETLRLQEEWLHSVNGMSLSSAPDEVDIAEASDAVTLFLKRAKRTQIAFDGKQEVDEVAQICHLLSGMPLGIELAAAWTNVLSSQEIRKEIERSLEFLTTSLQNVPERHRSLVAILEQTWQRLTAEEEQVLGKFSIFRGSCTLEAAQEVAGAALSTLALLVEKALLRRLHNGRYEMHELIRQFAADKAAAGHQTAEAQASHTDYFAEFSAAYAPSRLPQSGGGSASDRLNQLRIEFGNVQAAWSTSVQKQWMEPLMLMAEPMARLYEAEARYTEGTTQLQNAAQVLQAHAGRPEIAQTLAGINGWLGRFQLPLRLLAQAESYYLEQRTLAQRVGDKQEYATALAGLSRVAMDQGRPIDAEALAQSALDELKVGGKSRALVDAHHALGITHLARGNSELAEAHFSEAVATGQALGDNEIILPSLINLGFAALNAGEYDKSKRVLVEALELVQTTACKSELSRLYYRLGRTCETIGENQEALHYLRRAREIGTHEGNIYLVGTVDRSIGDIHRRLGDRIQARAYLNQALEAGYQIELTSSIGLSLSSLAMLEEEEGHEELAAQYLNEATDLGRQSGRKGDALFCLANLARVQVRMGMPEKAHQSLRLALAEIKPGSFHDATLIWLLSAAMYLNESFIPGETEKSTSAHEIFTFVCQQPAITAATRALTCTIGIEYGFDPDTTHLESVDTVEPLTSREEMKSEHLVDRIAQQLGLI
ncbi:MAG: BTAD domain-containing putative transcriptional regulator [Chloroflexota bacterium]